MKEIIDRLDREPLSVSLARTLRKAQAYGLKDLARWCQLELGGYVASNPEMDENTVVPEYRTVVGQHHDIYGRMLALKSDLAFVNETRLRIGVEELESLANSSDSVTIHNPDMVALIKKHLRVDVYWFRFSTVHLRGVLSAIKLNLSNKLMEVHGLPEKEQSRSESDEIVQLKPNFYGMGIDLRALWRRWKGPN